MIFLAASAIFSRSKTSMLRRPSRRSEPRCGSRRGSSRAVAANHDGAHRCKFWCSVLCCGLLGFHSSYLTSTAGGHVAHPSCNRGGNSGGFFGGFAPPHSFRPHPWSFSSKHGGAHSRAPMEATAPSCFHRGALPGGTAGRRPFPAVPIRRGGPMFVPLLSSLARRPSLGPQGSQVGLLDATNVTMAVPACAAPSNAYLAGWSLAAGPATPQQPRAPQRSAGLCSRRGRTNRGD